MSAQEETTYIPFNPEFLIIPYQLFTDDRLRPTDSLVYGIIYWFEHLKDGRCIASNQTIADFLRVSPRQVQYSIQRLRDFDYINVLYADATKQVRLEISTNVRLVHLKGVGVRTNVQGGTNKEWGKVRTNVHQRKEYKKGIKERKESFKTFKGEDRELDLDKRTNKMNSLKESLRQRGIIN